MHDALDIIADCKDKKLVHLAKKSRVSHATHIETKISIPNIVLKYDIHINSTYNIKELIRPMQLNIDEIETCL